MPHLEWGSSISRSVPVRLRHDDASFLAQRSLHPDLTFHEVPDHHRFVSRWDVTSSVVTLDGPSARTRSHSP